MKLVFELVSWEAGLGWDLELGFPLGTGLGWLGYGDWAGLGWAGGAGAGVLRLEPDFLKLETGLNLVFVIGTWLGWA